MKNSNTQYLSYKIYEYYDEENVVRTNVIKHFHWGELTKKLTRKSYITIPITHNKQRVIELIETGCKVTENYKSSIIYYENKELIKETIN